MKSDIHTHLRLRLVFEASAGTSLALGPGKGELLAQIAAKGSISAAGRAMGMSYRRAWLLVGEMNHGFRQPLIDISRGGSKGGGARLTQNGHRVLALFRALEARVLVDGAAELEELADLLGDMSGGE